MYRMALILWVGLATMAEAQSPAPEQARLARQHYSQGVSLMAAESWDEAARELQQAVALDPYFIVAYYNLGQTRMAQKRYTDAVTAYTDCVETIETLGNLSMKELGERERQRQDEINELNNALRQLHSLKNVNVIQQQVQIEDRLRLLESMQFRQGKPMEMPAEVPLALGSAYFRLNRLEDAEQQYLKAVDLDDELGPAHNNLAVIYLLTGRFEESEDAIHRAEKSGFRVNPNLKKDVKKAKEAARARP